MKDQQTHAALKHLLTQVGMRAQKRDTKRGPVLRGLSQDGQWTTRKGITDALKSAFYPLYNFRRAKHVGLAGEELRLATAWMGAKKNARNESAYKRRRTKGQTLGKKVDGQIRRIINDEGMPMRRPETLASVLVQMIEHMGYRRLVSQLPCTMGDDASYGTLIDAMALNPTTGGYVLIEYKVGYANYMHLASRQMKGPLAHKSDCPLNQHFIQLAFMKMMLERTHGIPVENAYVLQGTPSGVTPYRLPAWASQSGAAMWKHFCEFVK